MDSPTGGRSHYDRKVLYTVGAPLPCSKIETGGVRILDKQTPSLTAKNLEIRFSWDHRPFRPIPICWLTLHFARFWSNRSRSFAAHKFLPLPDLYGNPFTFEPDIRILGNESSSHGKRLRARR